jgi:hypothetical protein
VDRHRHADLVRPGDLGFLSWTGLQKRFLTRKTDRTAENMYDQYGRGDHPPKA